MQKDALLSQTVLMQYVESHSHVLKLLGCCTTDDRVALIVDYCALGNLREFLARNRRKFQVAIHGPYFSSPFPRIFARGAITKLGTPRICMSARIDTDNYVCMHE